MFFFVLIKVCQLKECVCVCRYVSVCACVCSFFFQRSTRKKTGEDQTKPEMVVWFTVKYFVPSGRSCF